jgi:hypothetical protein
MRIKKNVKSCLPVLVVGQFSDMSPHYKNHGTKLSECSSSYFAFTGWLKIPDQCHLVCHYVLLNRLFVNQIKAEEKIATFKKLLVKE